MSLSKLENKGCVLINKNSHTKEDQQIIVIGTARGGTSLVAGALANLGIFTGDRSVSPVFEDTKLSEAFENKDVASVRSIILEYTNKHKIWAWKRPSSLNYLDEVDKQVPNPFYIIIFKDIFSIANRNSISMKSDISKGLMNALDDYKKIVSFIEKTDKPLLLVSAEKAINYKEELIDIIIEQCKSFGNFSENREKALNFITPNPQDYLDATRITKGKGCVDHYNDQFISGWAFLVNNPENPAIIEILKDDKVIASATANNFRQDLKRLNMHKTGNCGFKMDISHLKLNGKYLIKVKDDVVPLLHGDIEINSPNTKY